MSQHTYALEDLGELRQGPTLSRYLDSAGVQRRILQIGNLGDLTVHTDAGDRTERLNEARAAEHPVQAGQVLISLRGSALKAATVEEDLQDAIVSNSVTTLIPNRRLVDPYFLTALLNSAGMQQQVAPLFTAVTAQGIPLAKFRKLRLQLPPLPQQQALASTFRRLVDYRRAAAAVAKLHEEEFEFHLRPFVIPEND